MTVSEPETSQLLDDKENKNSENPSSEVQKSEANYEAALVNTGECQ